MLFSGPTTYREEQPIPKKEIPMRTNIILSACAAGLLINGSHLAAQDQPPPAAPSATVSATVAPAATPASPPNADRMAQFRQRMNDRLKTALKVNDDEWNVIQPLLEKVQTKLRDSSPMRMWGGRNRAGGQGNNNGNNQPPVAGSGDSEALRAALDSDATTPDEIKAKLEALRESRKKSLAELAQAREDLRKVLTQRQEATLVLMGMLD